MELDAALGQLLDQGLVNLRATARYLQSRGFVPAGPSDAAVSALRRLRQDRKSSVGHATDLLRQARIEVTAPVASITIRHSEVGASPGALRSHLGPGLLAALLPRWQVHSPQGVRLIIPERRLDGAEARVLAVPEVQIRRGLAEVAVILASDARRIPGILAVACQRLALEAINIVETVDGFGQHTFLVAQDQAQAAAQVLKNGARARS